MNTQSEPLRVAMVGSSLRRGGAENQSVCVTRALLEAGIDVQFFYLGGGGYYEAVLQDLRVPVRQIYFPNRPWKMLFRLVGALRRWRPHIVLAFQFGDLVFGGPAGRLSRALVLGGVQSDGWYELRYQWSRSMMRLAHGILPNSRAAKDTLASQGVPPRKMEILANVLDLREFDARQALPCAINLPPNRVVVAAVGSLQRAKRFDRFLEALALARRQEPALAGIIAGGELGAKAEYEARAQDLGLIPDGVQFLGEVGNVPALLGRSAMLVLSSDYEGLPNVILEAMAARQPVITTAVGDAGTVVRHGQTGYVVERNDVETMADHMVRLAQSPSLRAELGEAGRKRVEQEYNYEILADRLVAVFHEFAEQHHRHSLCGLLERGDFTRSPGSLSSEAHVPSSREIPSGTLQSNGLPLES